jgi:hypothetical protein
MMGRFLKILWKVIKWIIILFVAWVIIWIVLFELGFCFKEYKFLTPQDLKERGYHIGLEKSMVSSANTNKDAPILTFEMVEKYRKKHPDSYRLEYTDDKMGTFEDYMRYFYPPDVAIQNAKDKNLTQIIVGVQWGRVLLSCGEGGSSLLVGGDELIYFEDLKDNNSESYREIIKEKLGEK